MRFADIHAQENTVKALKSSIKQNKVVHAYLFTGLRGCGKTSTAMAMACALNCDSPMEDGDACGTCLSCRRIESGNDPDVIIVRPDGNQTKIDDLRQMIDKLRFAPLSGKYITVIIEQADTLNASSENSILKILEEPPDYAVLILLSSNPETLLPTIRSRCRKVRFRTAGFEETLGYLKEHTELSDDDARIIAACSQGLIGKASELASDPKFMQERAAVLQKMTEWASGPDVMGLTLAESMRAMAESKRKNDPDVRTRVRRLSIMLEYILSWYSDILSLKVQGDSAFISNKDHEDTLRYLTDIYSVNRLTSAVRVIMDSRRYLEGNITPQLVLENMFFEIRPDLEVGR